MVLKYATLINAFKLICVFFIMNISVNNIQGQTIIGGTTGDSTAILDLQSNSKGLLIPRLTTEQREAIMNPGEGLMIYNTTLGCVEINVGSGNSPDWICLVGAAKIGSLDCGNITHFGNLITGVLAEDVVSVIPYIEGNNGNYGTQIINSTEVIGLKATLMSGNASYGDGNISLRITGIPEASGVAKFAINFGGKNCILERLVEPDTVALDCANAVVYGMLRNGVSADSVTVELYYSGSSGGWYSADSTNSTGIIGLKAILEPGIFEVGGGILRYAIRGIPLGSGVAKFNIDVNGQTCMLQLKIVSTESCGAYVANGIWKEFMCHNLGADTSVSSLSPSWALNGNYYQWGRNPDCFGKDGIDDVNTCTGTVYGVAGPWGNDTSNDNAGNIPGFSSLTASNNAWLDWIKTINDPCPEGFRVPTRNQWAGIANPNLNEHLFIGSWESDLTNYSSGVMIGDFLFLPAAGRREHLGAQYFRGNLGFYWSSTNGWHLYFDSGNIATYNNFIGTYATPIRCIAE